ncbi:MAG: hypothetical protein BJ554DRAFT_3674 [Olpidium bornovanus]|uniref:Uncharacterized protein n=1 Tax=Olpidium bornovanus TaxID=278681 RepID=A0A8H8DLI8_9FUNG|nr:MAG: hypothetical protein BJ554DRAFT_3674 [Olpidium bornovanus]
MRSNKFCPRGPKNRPRGTRTTRAGQGPPPRGKNRPRGTKTARAGQDQPTEGATMAPCPRAATMAPRPRV